MRNFFTNKKDEPSIPIDPFIVYTPDNFNVSQLYTYLASSLKESSKKKFAIESKEQSIYIYYDIVDDTKKQKKSQTVYQLDQDKNQCIIEAQKVVSFMNDTPEEITKIDLYTKKHFVVDLITKHINDLLDDDFFADHVLHKMEFITQITDLEQNFLLSKLKPKEITLACLRITNLKSDQFEVLKKHQYYLVITSKRNLILGSDEKKFTLEDITGQTLDLKEKIGKDTIQSSLISFDTELFNDQLFVRLQNLFNIDTLRKIEKYADVLFDKYHTKEPHIKYLQKLYLNKNDENENLLRKNIKALLLVQFPQKKCSKTLVLQKSFMELLYHESDFGNTLYQVTSDWNIDAQEQFHFLELLTKNQDNFKLKNLNVFYDAALAGVLNQKKSPKNSREHRVNHLKYLKDTQQYKKAIPFYEFVLENLEDDSILELISDTKTDILNGKDCNPIRIQILEDLSEIKRNLNLSNETELLEIAKLQPMVLDRLTQLVASGVSEQKANTILSLFANKTQEPNGIAINHHNFEQQYDKAMLFDLVVPTCFKDAKGFLNTFTNLIAQSNPPDYKQVTAYSEKLSPANYPEAYAILKKTVEQLQMEIPECYIGNGDFSKGIIGVEGPTNFLILGKNHLDTNNELYLNDNELKFNLSIELSHILFNHTKITSKDVWRGAKSKGMNIAGVLLIALPVVSTVGNFAGKFLNIAQYSKLLTGVDRVTDAVGKGQSAIEYGEKITEKITSGQQESELLATSRLMEISADRIGLLLTNDLKSSIIGLLKLSDNYAEATEKIKEKGLLHYLAEKNEKSEFIHQELIIRIKTLCSFYLNKL